MNISRINWKITFKIFNTYLRCTYVILGSVNVIFSSIAFATVPILHHLCTENQGTFDGILSE